MSSLPLKTTPTVTLSPLASTRRMTKAMMGVAGLLLIAAAGGFYVLNGQIQSIAKVESNKEAQVGSNQQIAKRYNATLTSYNETCAQLRFLEKPVAPENFVPTLLPQMQKLAQSCGCEVQSMKPGQIVANTPSPMPKTVAAAAAIPKYQVMPLSMSITGTYPQIMHFVYDLTRFPKIVSLKSLNLSPGGSNSKGSEGELSASITMNTYVFPADSNTMLPEVDTTKQSNHLGSISQTHQEVNDIVAQGNAAAAAKK